MAGKTKLTPFVRKKLIELIELGMPEGRAASAIGITPQTFIRWKHRGETPTHPENGDIIYVNLVNDLAQAEAKFIQRNIERIDKGADKDPEHAKWLLERRDPGEFGRRIELEVGPSKVLLALQENAQKALGKGTQREIATQALIAAVDDTPEGNED